MSTIQQSKSVNSKDSNDPNQKEKATYDSKIKEGNDCDEYDKKKHRWSIDSTK
jgi:hypothetical protein